jgi:hypothetical protein
MFRIENKIINVVGIATRYVLDGLRIPVGGGGKIFRSRPDRP